MRTSVLKTVLAVALVAGAACKGADSPTLNYHFAALVRGANVAGATDTLVSGTMTLNRNAADSSWTYTYTTTAANIDSVALYQVAATAAITSATAATSVLCSTTAGCTGSGTSAAGTAKAALYTAARGYGVQVVFFATGTRPNNGVMRGTVYPLAD